MSGPWDRSAPRDADDAWPGEDRADAPEQPRAHAPDPGPWSGDDPWGDRQSTGGSEWAGWSPSSAPDEMFLDEADLPVSDPWAESWAAEPETLPATREPWTDDAPVEPPPRAAEPAWTEPEPWRPAEPWADEAAAIADDAARAPADRAPDEPSAAQAWGAATADPWPVIAADEPWPGEQPISPPAPLSPPPDGSWSKTADVEPEEDGGAEGPGKAWDLDDELETIPGHPSMWETAAPPAAEPIPEASTSDDAAADAVSDETVPEVEPHAELEPQPERHERTGPLSRLPSWLSEPMDRWMGDIGQAPDREAAEPEAAEPVLEPEAAEPIPGAEPEPEATEPALEAPEPALEPAAEAAQPEWRPAEPEVTALPAEPEAAEPEPEIAASEPAQEPEVAAPEWRVAEPEMTAEPAEPEPDAPPEATTEPIRDPWPAPEAASAVDLPSEQAAEEAGGDEWPAQSAADVDAVEPESGLEVGEDAPRPPAWMVWPPITPETADAAEPGVSGEAEPHVEAEVAEAEVVEEPPIVTEREADDRREQRPEAEPEPEPVWPERADQTQVLPVEWAPRESEPPPWAVDQEAEPSDAAQEPRTGELEPRTGPIRVSLADRQAAASAAAEVEERPTTAEQAVPWLIGVILLLAGMVIVLMALIFLGDASLGASGPSPTQLSGILPSAEPEPSASVAPTATPTARPASSSEPSATPAPLPEYGPLEMIYQGRSAALAPIYLLHDDFTTTDAATVLAQDPELDVRRFAWAPDGTVGACLLSDLLVTVEPGVEKRPLGRGIASMTFGDQASTLYAVRVSEDGASDIATILSIDFASGDATEIASMSYERPELPAREALVEAQLEDDGGAVRLLWLEGDVLRLWVVGIGMWDISPDDGEVTEVDAEAPNPTLWAPDGRRRVAIEYDGATTTLRAVTGGSEVASTTLDGKVSHLRWSPSGERVAFTLGIGSPNGGVLQDLYLWDVNDDAPMKLTTSGANFGAEWRGSQPLWRP